ncbi:LysR substrate-binding domain-containing protein [Roseicitreum antarcticum]|uniref:LysR family transcriptional regulator, pca operon transcriptional activator n=1 Tax=Roseicitreum antarcticum TaxID=564137 RepID=A0A1H2QPU4_9RHOB|nr:LysR substrate-binding domain-containing protein [Roseicitreum antarcticum]SDW09207.1 LysR family transcriptional regulator, pca operon transcriptional activator [Roseicitreum antarcticum]
MENAILGEVHNQMGIDGAGGNAHAGLHPGVKLRHIRAFLDIAAFGSITGAAQAQGVTQPALSRTLAELEALLATPLFRRDGRKLALTEAGALFRHHASLGVQAFEAAANALHPGRAEAVIRAGVLPTAATQLFPHVALRFHALRPDSTLAIITGPHSHLMQLLRRGRIDLMLGRMPDAGEMQDMSFEHLYDDDIVLVARAGHPAQAAGLSLAATLRRYPVILPPHGAIIRRPVEALLAAHDLSALRPAFETVALTVGCGIVVQSDAVWFISRGVVSGDLALGRMQVLATDAAYLSGAVGLTTRPGPAAASGVDLIRQITLEIVAAGLHR